MPTAQIRGALAGAERPNTVMSSIDRQRGRPASTQAEAAPGRFATRNGVTISCAQARIPLDFVKPLLSGAQGDFAVVDVLATSARATIARLQSRRATATHSRSGDLQLRREITARYLVIRAEISSAARPARLTVELKPPAAGPFASAISTVPGEPRVHRKAISHVVGGWLPQPSWQVAQSTAPTGRRFLPAKVTTC